MKQLFTFILILSSFAASAGNLSAPEISQGKQGAFISFSVAKEVNIKYYVLEGSDDNTAYELVTRIDPVGNSMLSRNYSIPLSGKLYRYYRLRQVDMNQLCVYSPSSPAFAGSLAALEESISPEN